MLWRTTKEFLSRTSTQGMFSFALEVDKYLQQPWLIAGQTAGGNNPMERWSTRTCDVKMAVFRIVWEGKFSSLFLTSRRKGCEDGERRVRLQFPMDPWVFRADKPVAAQTKPWFFCVSPARPSTCPSLLPEPVRSSVESAVPWCVAENKRKRCNQIKMKFLLLSWLTKHAQYSTP